MSLAHAEPLHIITMRKSLLKSVKQHKQTLWGRRDGKSQWPWKVDRANTKVAELRSGSPWIDISSIQLTPLSTWTESWGRKQIPWPRQIPAADDSVSKSVQIRLIKRLTCSRCRRKNTQAGFNQAVWKFIRNSCGLKHVTATTDKCDTFWTVVMR